MFVVRVLALNDDLTRLEDPFPISEINYMLYFLN